MEKTTRFIRELETRGIGGAVYVESIDLYTKAVWVRSMVLPSDRNFIEGLLERLGAWFDDMMGAWIIRDW
jgi:hypothetical protein